MKIEVKDYSYETMPEYVDEVAGAKTITMTGEEIGVEYIPNVIYSQPDGQDLTLQILQPKMFNDPERIFPCVVFIQGSAWMKQNVYRNVPHLGRLASRGYVCAIVEYRHSGIAHFPAQIVDAKNAIRFLKRHADTYHLNPDQVIIMGDSSGGQVACLTGMTAKTWELDGPAFKDVDIQVKGIIDLYGAVDITMADGFPITIDHQQLSSPEGQLMGFNIMDHLALAKQACARSYVDYDFPPVLILHGTKDRLVFCEQSVQLYQALKAAQKDVELYLVKHADHGGAIFWSTEAIDLYDRFIQRCLFGI